jgi:hypothetical protein
MRPPLKLNSIDTEHLQELYNASGVARDELPYTDAFETLWSGFQDRTFKNAEREQVFGAILKYVRSSSNAAGADPPFQKRQTASLQRRTGNRPQGIFQSHTDRADSRRVLAKRRSRSGRQAASTGAEESRRGGSGG